MEPKNNAYTIIEQPIELRKELLITSRSIIQVLMINEKIKLLRKEKLEKLHEVEELFKDINELLRKIEELLPTLTIEETRPKLKKEKVKSKEQKNETKSKKRANKLDHLYEQLKEIDSILKKLPKS